MSFPFDFVVSAGSDFLPEQSGITNVGSPSLYYSSGFFNSLFVNNIDGNFSGNFQGNVSGYLPLAGGTLVGDLTGINAWFGGILSGNNGEIGNTLQVGLNISSGPVTNPALIDMGSSIGNSTAGNVNNLKLKTYDAGGITAGGLGISLMGSNNLFEYQATANGSHSFFAGGNFLANISANGIMTNTFSGNLVSGIELFQSGNQVHSQVITPLFSRGDTVGINQVSSSSNGYLSSGDYSTFKSGFINSGNYLPLSGGTISGTSSGTSPLIIRVAPGQTADYLQVFNSSGNKNASISYNPGGIATALNVLNNDNQGYAQTTMTTKNNVIGFMTAWDGGWVYFGSQSNHDTYLYTNNLRRLTVKAAGNIGINNASPGGALDVTGTISGISGVFQTGYFQSGITLASQLNFLGVQNINGTSDVNISNAGNLIVSNNGMLEIANVNGILPNTSGQKNVGSFASPFGYGYYDSGIFNKSLSGLIIYESGIQVINQVVSPLVKSAGDTISIPSGSASQNGYLSSYDWVRFNNVAVSSGIIGPVSSTLSGIPVFSSTAGNNLQSSNVTIDGSSQVWNNTATYCMLAISGNQTAQPASDAALHIASGTYTLINGSNNFTTVTNPMSIKYTGTTTFVGEVKIFASATTRGNAEAANLMTYLLKNGSPVSNIRMQFQNTDATTSHIITTPLNWMGPINQNDTFQIGVQVGSQSNAMAIQDAMLSINKLL